MATDPIEERLRAAADAFNSEITDEDIDKFTDKVLTRLGLACAICGATETQKHDTITHVIAGTLDTRNLVSALTTTGRPPHRWDGEHWHCLACGEVHADPCTCPCHNLT